MEILEAIRWRPGIGDPTPLGWLTVLAYLVVTIICTVYAFRLWQAKGLEHRRRQIAAWVLVAFLLFLLGINKQLDIQTLLSQIGREISRTQGWYSDRRAIQFVFIIFVACTGTTSIAVLAFILRKSLRRHWLTFLGLLTLLLFVVIRAVSFHYVDAFLYTNIFGQFTLSSAIELLSLIIIGTSLITAIRALRAQSDSGSNPIYTILISGAVFVAMLGIALVLGLLTLLLPNQATSFAEAAEPYTHSTQLEQPTSEAAVFNESFAGSPDQPTPWRPSSTWDVTIHTREWTYIDDFNPVNGIYDTNCQNPETTHRIEFIEDGVYQCNDRLITAINGLEYAAVALTPNQLIDFSNGTAELSFELSTTRTSHRDWVDIWITPYHDHIQLPTLGWVADLNGPPARGLHIQLNLGQGERFIVRQFTAEGEVEINTANFTYDEYLDTTRGVMGRYRLTLNQDQVQFGLPEHDAWWVDRSFDTPLDWDMGVVQFAHHSFVPTQDCGECTPNSWEWDNIAIEPARPFTIIPATQRYVNRGTDRTLTFAAPAPENSYLRFMALSDEVQLSFDGGETWQQAMRAPYTREQNSFRSHWTPIPAGLTEITFRALDDNGRDWQIRDISVWSLQHEE